MASEGGAANSQAFVAGNRVLFDEYNEYIRSQARPVVTRAIVAASKKKSANILLSHHLFSDTQDNLFRCEQYRYFFIVSSSQMQTQFCLDRQRHIILFHFIRYFRARARSLTVGRARGRSRRRDRNLSAHQTGRGARQLRAVPPSLSRVVQTGRQAVSPRVGNPGVCGAGVGLDE